MPQLMQVEIMDPEEAARLLEAKSAENAAKERARLAAANRALGLPEPKPGDRLYVTTARGIPRRSRAACLFSELGKTEVRVVSEDQPTGPVMDGDKHTGVFAVHAHGAEMILNDSSLTVTAQNAQEVDASDLRRQLAAKDAEIERLKTDHARQLREARQSARDAGDGSPQRLIAQRKANAKLSDPDFGGKD